MVEQRPDPRLGPELALFDQQPASNATARVGVRHPKHRVGTRDQFTLEGEEVPSVPGPASRRALVQGETDGKIGRAHV